jgi:hypothetical protein
MPDETLHVYLAASNKIVYMRHRCFLPIGHKYRLKRMDKYFDNMDEAISTAPSGRSAGKRVFQIVSKVTFIFVKKTKGGKKRKDVKASKRGHIQEDVHFFKVFAILVRLRHMTCDRWYACPEECFP